MLKPFIVWDVLPRNSSTPVFDAESAPTRPLAEHEARQFARRTVPEAARGYAYVHGENPTDAIRRYRSEYAEFIGR